MPEPDDPLAAGALTYRTVTPELADACEELERTAFPHADPDDLITADDVLAYTETFPDGFLVCLDGERLAGQAAGILLDFDFDRPEHTLAGITGEHQCGNHDPDGDWYYGTDLVVHPDYRRRGLGHAFYELRKDVARRYGCKGIIAGSHIPGYAGHRDAMSVADYLERVVAGDLYDPTLSFQLQEGFEVRGVLPGYLHDDSTGGDAALIVWQIEG